jgi:hypothetical protein
MGRCVGHEGSVVGVRVIRPGAVEGGGVGLDVG